MKEANFEEFLRGYRSRIEALCRSSGAARWFVKPEDFARAVWEGIERAAQAEPGAVPELLESIRAEDLALALACVSGNERAWDQFWSAYRPALYETAHSFIRDQARARELADSLLAELYGLDATRPGRNSRLAYFHGRSSLKTWLRAVLYQKFVDEYRHQSRLTPLADAAAGPAAEQRSVSVEDDRRYAACLSAAVEAVLAELPADDKLLLGYYYVQGLTLNKIGRLRGEHEATLSRHLGILRKKLRKRIESHLRRVEKLSAFEVERCLDFASRGVMVRLDKVLKTE